MQHKNKQCWKCNFEKTCDGLLSGNCDVIDIETYERLVAMKKNDLQGKAEAAVDEARDEIKMKQSQFNEMIENDPRIPLETLNEKIETEQVQSSLTEEVQPNLSFFGLTIQSILTIKPESPVPRLCQLMRANNEFPWGLSLRQSGPWNYFVRVANNGPAENAGIRENDRLLEVNNEPVEGLTHAQVVQMVRYAKLTLTLLVDSDS